MSADENEMAMEMESVVEVGWQLEAAAAGDGGGCRPPPWRRRLRRATRGEGRRGEEENKRERKSSLVGGCLAIFPACAACVGWGALRGSR